MIPSISIFGPNPNFNFKCITLHSLTLTPTTHSLSLSAYIYPSSSFSSFSVLISLSVALNHRRESECKAIVFFSDKVFILIACIIALMQSTFPFALWFSAFCNLECLFLDLFHSSTLFYVFLFKSVWDKIVTYLIKIISGCFVSDYLYSYYLIYTEWNVVDCGDL